MTDTTQEEANARDMADMRAVDRMLKTAAAARMSVEVVLSFAEHVKSGDTPSFKRGMGRRSCGRTQPQ